MFLRNKIIKIPNNLLKESVYAVMYETWENTCSIPYQTPQSPGKISRCPTIGKRKRRERNK